MVSTAAGRGPADGIGGHTYNHSRHGRRLMTPLLRLAQLQAAMLSMALLFASATLACEKHLKGHQNSTDTQTEGIQR